MDVKPLSDEEVMSPAPKPLNDDEVNAPAQENPNAHVPYPDTDPSDPVNQQIFQQSGAGKILNAAQGNAITRSLKDMSAAVGSALTDGGRLGLSDDSIKSLQDLGVLPDLAKRMSTMRETLTAAVLMPAAAAADAVTRTLNAGVTGAIALVQGATGEVTHIVDPQGSQGQGMNPVGEAQFTADNLYAISGMSEFGTPITLEGRAKQTMGEALSAPPLAEKATSVVENKPPVFTTPVKSPLIDEASGNLNLKYINESEDVKSMLGQTAQAYADESGVVITHAQTIEESQKFLDDAMTETGNGVPESLANYMRGDPVNRPLLYAARQLTIQSTRDALEAVQQAVRTGAPTDASAAMSADERMMEMTGIRHEVTAEAGRTLNSAAIPLGEQDENLAQLAEKLSGMTQEDRIRLMSTFDSPDAIARFVRDVKKPSWGDMGIFYIINNYLSGPITHLAYTASWAAQTVIRAGIETPTASMVGRVQKAVGDTLEPLTIKALQDERETLTRRLAEADSTQGRPLKAADAAAMEKRVKEISTKLNNSVTVMPGEAAARFYGIKEGAMDSIRAAGRALKTGNIQMLPGEMAAAKTAAKEATDAAIKDGKSAAEAQKAGEAAYNKNAIYSSNPIIDRATLMKSGVAKDMATRAGLVIGIPTRVIAAVHSFQKFSGYAESSNALAYRQAISEGLKTSDEIGARIAQIKSNMPPEMIKQAADEAKYAALMGKPGALGQALENFAHVNNWTRMVVPFSRVVTNLTTQKVLERTPVGLLSPKVLSDIAGKNGNAAQANSIAKMVAGSTLLAAGAGLAAEGINNGDIPDVPGKNPADVRARAYLAGTPPYTIRIGDWNVPHRFFGVAAGSLSLGADVHSIFQTARSDDDAWAVMGNSIHVLGNDMLQENALKGAADLYDAIRDRDGNKAKVYVLNAVAAAATPYSVGMSQITRAIDPIMRSTMGSDFWDRFKKTEESHIPWESSSLLPQVDIFGRPMQRGGDYQGMLNDPVMQALQKLDIYPAKAATKIMNVKLNDQQYFDYATKAGALFYHGAEQMVSDPSWPSYDAKKQADLLHQVQTEARAGARQYMCIAYPDVSKSCAKYNTDLVKPDDQ